MAIKRAKVGWSDMFPSILDEEILLIDDSIKPKVGDVVNYRAPSGEVFPHRLIYTFFGYYFTKGDNNKLIDLPSKPKDYSGVIIGKYENVRIHFLLKFILSLSILFFIMFNPSLSFKKRAINFISYMACLEQLIYYPHKYDNDLVNRSIYNLPRDKIPDNYSQLNLRYAVRKCFENKIALNSWFFKRANPIVYNQKLEKRNTLFKEFNKLKYELEVKKIHYVSLKGVSYPYIRDMADIDLFSFDLDNVERVLINRGFNKLFDNDLESGFLKKIGGFDIYLDLHKRFPGISYNFDFPLNKKEVLEDSEKFIICCSHIFKQGHICLRDIVDINYFLTKIDLNKIKLKNKGIKDILGAPLIFTYLFNKRYLLTQNEVLSEFVRKYYFKELVKIEKYLEKRNYEMPVYFLHLYSKTKVFRLHKFLREPHEIYDLGGDFILKGLLKKIIKYKNIKMKNYVYKRR